MNRKVVLVTGSSIGLGKCIIEKYASNNYDVVIHYLNHENEAKELQKSLEEKYNINTLLVKADIKNEDDIKKMKGKIKNTFGKLDVLINNAGIAIDTPFEMKTKENFMGILETNVVGTFLVTKELSTLMNEGNIVIVSSTNGIDTYYEEGLDYDASKAALINLTHNLAHHYSPNIRVNCVCPGWMNTPMNKEISDEFKKQEEEKILLNRFAEPEEVANVIYFITSDEATYVNDSIIRVDGGKK